MNSELAFYLDSIGDHVEALLTLRANAALDPEFVQRLRAHILFEERQTAQALERLQLDGPDAFLLQVAKDHSFLLQKLLTIPNIPAELEADLLEHFAEEHEHYGSAPAPAAVAREDAPRGWTVGSLRKRA